MAKFNKGNKVTQIVTPITGTVEGYQVDAETGEVLVLVGYKDAEGNTASRYFKENELE